MVVVIELHVPANVAARVVGVVGVEYLELLCSKLQPAATTRQEKTRKRRDWFLVMGHLRGVREDDRIVLRDLPMEYRIEVP